MGGHLVVVWLCVEARVHTHTHTHILQIHTYGHIFVHTRTHIYTYIHMYIYILWHVPLRHAQPPSIGGQLVVVWLCVEGCAGRYPYVTNLW